MAMALNLNRPKIARNLLLMIAIFAALGAIEFFKPATLAINTLQTKVRTKPVSGDIVVVGIDASSIDAIGRWPWPRSVQADLYKQLDSYNPKAIYLDIDYKGKTNAADDEKLRKTLADLKTPTKIHALASSFNLKQIDKEFADKSIIGTTPLVSAVTSSLFGYIWSQPAAVVFPRGTLMGATTSIAGLKQNLDKDYRIDYNFDPDTVPHISAKDVINGTVTQNKIKGKTVIVGITDALQNDVHSMPGWGRRPGVFFIVLGAETLKQGFPRDLGWWILFPLAMAIAAAHMFAAGLRHSKFISWTAAIICISVSTGLTMLHLTNDLLPSIGLIAAVAIYAGRVKKSLLQTQRHNNTGLLDMSSFNVEEALSARFLIGASIKSTAPMWTMHSQEEIDEIMRQVGHRLSAIIDEQALTHDQQHFLWEMPVVTTDELASHLSALQHLFIEPVTVRSEKISVDICFGVDRDTTKNLKLRKENALRASQEAQEARSTFKIATTASFDEHLEDHFDFEFTNAVANNAISFLLQPHKSLKSNHILSAELFASWTHPAYGQISNDRLMDLARNSESLYSLILAICEKAAETSSLIDGNRNALAISVKIPVETITDANFSHDIMEIMQRVQCRPNSIMLEIMDLQQKQNSQLVLNSIRHLRECGFKIGIGNFGSSNNDLSMLKSIKPDEIFLPKSLTAQLVGNARNQTFVLAVLRIAGSSDIVITADDLDNHQVLDQLKSYNCNKASGKLLAKTINIHDFIKDHALNQAQNYG
jgi:diguanylate cyclase